MTSSQHRRLRMSMATLILLVAAAVWTDRLHAQGPYSCVTATSCVPLALNANLQLTNLHPLVSHVMVVCTGVMPNGTISGSSSQMPVVNRGYTGTVITSLNVPQSVVASAANHAINVSCKLRLVKDGGQPGQVATDAVATAAQPLPVAFDNWAILATGATVSWTQSVTFPNLNPVP
jgi:hypothetical protein